MKLGVCWVVSDMNFLETAEFYKNAGFEYVEGYLNAYGEIKEDFLIECSKKLDEMNFKMEATCGFFPWAMKLVGPERNMQEIESYLDHVSLALKYFKPQYSVMGCGNGRNPYGDMTKEQALDDFEEIVIMAANRASQYGVTIVIEPLGFDETGILNTIVESAEFVKRINEKGIENVKLLIDYFHMAKNDEDLSDILKVKDLIKHVHIACKTTRAIPTNNDNDKFDELFAILKQAGYEGRVSIEAWVPDDYKGLMEECPKFVKPLL